MGIYLNGALQAREGGRTNGNDVMVQWYSLHLCTRQWHVEAETIIVSKHPYWSLQTRMGKS